MTTKDESCLISGIFSHGRMLEISMDAKLVEISCGSYVSSHENEALEAWKAARYVTTSTESFLIKRNFIL